MSRAGRPRKDSVDLPEWFDIEKYRGVRDLDAMGWYEQLIYRGRLIIAYDKCQRNGDKDTKHLEAAIKILRDDPIITEERIAQTKKFVTESESQSIHPEWGECTGWKGYFDFDPVIGLTVRPVNGEAVTLMTMIQRANIKPDDEGGDIEGKFVPRADGSYEFKNPPLTWCGRPVVAIDPAVSDDIIMRETRNLLREIRKTEKPHPTAFTKNSDFIKWYNSGALPYIDLSFWEMLGHPFKGSAFINELVEIMDGDSVSSESAAIKAAQTFAKGLLTAQTIRTLEVQASHERKHGAQKSSKFLVR